MNSLVVDPPTRVLSSARDMSGERHGTLLSLLVHASVHFSPISDSLFVTVHPSSGHASFVMQWHDCPSCQKSAVYLLSGIYGKDGKFTETSRELVFPQTTGRPPPSTQVPKALVDDYNKACSVLNKSPKASAALSRRILQTILRDFANVKKGTLQMKFKKYSTAESYLQNSHRQSTLSDK
jgi:hypothetical protein